MSEETFYLVWCPSGNQPTHRHGTSLLACGEADRLAALNPGKRFYVLKATEYFSRDEVVHTVLLEKEEEMPF